MDVMIYAEFGNKDHPLKMVLNNYIKVTNEFKSKLGGKKAVLQYIKENYPVSRLMQEFVRVQRGVENLECIHVEPVTVIRGKWIRGEYYAHEYHDDPYTTGKGRKVRYSNGYIEYEIKCTDFNKDVMDGMWDEASYSRISNGCGDHFTPYEEGLI